MTLTAGDAGGDRGHWTSRHAGGLVSLLRAFSGWNPYDAVSADVAVAYATELFAGRAVLRTTVRCGNAAATMYALHLRDGSPTGDGYAPVHESLARLRSSGRALSAVWPEDGPPVYHSWGELAATVRAIVDEECGDATSALIYSSDPDPESNPGDHSDHVCTGALVRDIVSADARLDPFWIAMYDIGNRPENLSAVDADLQRAAVYAYGAGYAAHAAGLGPAWRHGWEREFQRFGGRQYLRRDD